MHLASLILLRVDLELLADVLYNLTIAAHTLRCFLGVISWRTLPCPPGIERTLVAATCHSDKNGMRCVSKKLRAGHVCRSQIKLHRVQKPPSQQPS